MGNATATDLAGLVTEGEVGLRLAVLAHLQSNHFPPVHSDFLPVALSAITLANEADWECLLTMPNDRTLTVGQIVEGLHLYPFLDSEKSE